MVNLPAIAKEKRDSVTALYKSGLSMQQVADRYHVSIDAVTYILRKNGVPRRSFAEANKLKFESKKPSFIVRRRDSSKAMEMDLIGAMLYWAEGYKRETATGVDFANSDPRMSKMFMMFLRSRYRLDESRLRLQIFCYADQDVKGILRFWSHSLGIPQSQFQSPYIRTDYRTGGRKMMYGVSHIRYNDKKLLKDMLELIQSSMQRYGISTET